MAQRSDLRLRGEPCFIVGMMDLTRQKQLEQDVLTISENERERFGQELHDDVCQQLAALSLYTTILGKKIEAKLGDRLAEVEELSSLIDGILAHVRALSRGLFPIEVGEQSLDRVFDQFLVRIEGQTKLRCRLDSNLVGNTGLSAQDELHLFRILQEAVQNTLKYARASAILVRLFQDGPRLRLTYEDDGVGMAAETREGVGLRSMRYRASQLGARLSVGQAERGGVSLELDLLLSEKGGTP
jgi:signal transduction histidine kinase